MADRWQLHALWLGVMTVCACGDSGTPTGWHARAAVGLGPIQEVGVVALQGRMYVVGGFDSRSNITSSVQVYDPSSDSWGQIAPLPIGMHHPNVAVIDGRLFVLGALIEHTFTATGTVWEYWPDEDRWLERTRMPPGTERGASAVGVIGGMAYVAGGVRVTAVAEVTAYDATRDSWTTEVPNLPNALDHLTGEVVDGTFYVMGGRRGTLTSVVGDVYAFTPGSGWKRRTPMPTSRAGTASGVVNGRIVVVGGEGNANAADGMFSEAEIYDPVADRWATLPPMRTPRHGMGAVGIAGALYVPGGGVRHSLAASAVHEVLFVDDLSLSPQ